jgi:hypothetical protein
MKGMSLYTLGKAFSNIVFLAVIAALAVLFETISWLRGTLGNVVYFVLWLILLIISGRALHPHPGAGVGRLERQQQTL